MDNTAEQQHRAPLALEPFEFDCEHGRFRILNDSCTQKLADLWVRIDTGNPEKIGQVLKAGLFVLLMGLAHLIDWTPPSDQPREEVARVAQMARTGKTEGLML
ncbi:MAG: hypothetical protein OQK12_09890 [Motiliproteus sp.]|nr:hypothetical protein [Motiliproteus sp.]MCW9051270.1 hypothetical protein [Motiliproteus sp.]